MVDSYKGVRREHMPISSFDPRYRELLLAGVKAETRVPCANLKAARRMRSLLCSYRSRMKRHFGDKRKSEWETLYQCVVGLDEDRNEVVIRPRSHEFDALLAPGTSIEKPGEDAPHVEDAAPLLESDPLAEFVPEPETKE